MKCRRMLHLLLVPALALFAAGCSVEVPMPANGAVGMLQLSDQRAAVPAPDPTDAGGGDAFGATTAEGATAAGDPGAIPPSGVPSGSSSGEPEPPSRPLNRAEQMLPQVNVKPWPGSLPVVVQSPAKDMQCTIDRDGAACYLLTEVPPRPADLKGLCTGSEQYYGGYAVVTGRAGSQYGTCGHGVSPMEREESAGDAFAGPMIEDGQTVRIGNMVCERAPQSMKCAHLRTGRGFMISSSDYELW